MVTCVEQRAILRGILGRKWQETACRAFALKPRMVQYLDAGRFPLTLRQQRVLETYASQKARTRTQRDARRMAALERALRKEAMAEEEAARALGASLARLKREGKI